MSFVADSFENYLVEVLNLPLVHRCNELGILIDRSSTKELQDCFPRLVCNIFGVVGGTGWGFRTITRLNNLPEFDALYHFFVPMGPMFRLCYRLLNESIKFDVPVELLPTKMVQMLCSQYSQFYSDMIQIDPCRRQIVSLSLNAFDFYVLHFILHGMVPLHKMHPAAMAVHNENLKTIYFFLTADYVCSFLPSDPSAVVLPTNICSSVKMTTAMPIQPIQPTRSPKYLMTSALSQHFNPIDTANIRSPETPRTFSWRTETVLYFSVDCWLRYDVDGCRELPSSEFIRVIRILVKQLHAFGNSADLDNTSMGSLRKLAQPMMNAQIYTFLKQLIARWPLDSSFSVVLELWLSFIQPWRYTFGRTLYPNLEPKIQKKNESFIAENLICYTQIFVQIMPRFERLDFSSIKNSLMIFRVLKVFNQPHLAQILRQAEASGISNRGLISTPASNKTYSVEQQNISHLTFKSAINYTGTSDFNDWPTYRQDLIPDTYVHLFGPQVQAQLKNLMKKMLITKEMELHRVEQMKNEIRLKHQGLLKYIKWLFFTQEDILFEQTLNDCRKIPDILDNAMQSLSNIFEIPMADVEKEIAPFENPDILWDDVNPHFDISDISANTSSSIYCSSILMNKRLQSLNYTGDPVLKPIASNEFTFLVRFLHQISIKLNLMFSDEINQYWSRNDIWGRLCRQILYPPMIVQSFDKSQGVSMLHEQRMGPRINLRFIGSYRTFCILIASFVFGQLFFGLPSFGFILLLFVTVLYIFLLSLFNDQK